MTTMGTETPGRHAAPVNGTVTNGALVPFTFPPGPVSGWPQPPAPAKDRHRRRDGTAFIVVALLNAAIVAVVAFSGSWQHQYELSIHLGQAHWVAGMQPLSVEGLIAAASLVIWYAARHGHRRPWGGYLVLALGIGQTVLMNLGADHRYAWPWLGPEISVWPAVAFVAAYEMAVWLVRKRQDGAVQSREDKQAGKPAGQPDKHVDKPADRQADKPPPRRAIPARTAMDKAAAAIRDNPDLADRKAWTALAEIAGVSAKTVQRARNGTARTP